MTAPATAPVGGSDGLWDGRLVDEFVERQRARQRRILVTQVVVVGGLLGGWQLISTASPAVAHVISSPSAVARTLANWATFPDAAWADLAATSEAAVLGFLVGTTLALLVGLVFVEVPTLARLFSPLVAAINAMPKVVLAPLLVLWFGLGLTSKVIFVITGVFFIVFYNVYTGGQNVDRTRLTAVRVLGGKRAWTLREVYLPAMLGWILASLRISVAFAFLGAVVAEFLGSNRGLGHLILQGQSALDQDQVIAGIILVAVIAVAADLLIVRFERRYIKWRPE